MYQNLGILRQEIFEFVRTTLDNLGITFDGLVSQAYDGASVMSGCRGGLQFFGWLSALYTFFKLASVKEVIV